MEESSDVHFKQRAVKEFLTAEKVPLIEIHRRMQDVYGDQCVDMSTVRRRVRRFIVWELGQADMSDKTRSGRISKTIAALVEVYWSAVVILWKNNYAALKIIGVGIFLFLFH